MSHFYPRPPRGGRPLRKYFIFGEIKFLSTPSARRATVADHGGNAVGVISIHALREEGDRPASRNRQLPRNFYPRPPRGGRPKDILMGLPLKEFLSTPSARRATRSAQSGQRGGGDFYPRPPRGGRPKCVIFTCNQNLFLSTPSARRATISYGC